MLRTLFPVPFLLVVNLFISGCGPAPANPQAMGGMKAPDVLVGVPAHKQVADFEDTTGRVEALKTVDIRARVTGYLQKINFKEGSPVKENDILFEIDARPYRADLAKASAAMVQSESHLNRLKSDYQRASNLRSRNAIGKEEFDKIAGDRDEAQAAVEVAKAAHDISQLNVDFCQVRAPIDGVISRKYLDVGNLVKADDTLMTNIVTLNPMYAYFVVDERTLLKLTRLMRSGDVPNAEGLKILLGLADEEGFPHSGKIDFVDNRLDNATGTLTMRATFANPKGLMTPGLFVRIRVPIGEPQAVIVVPEEAIGTDQGRKFLYVVDDEDKAAYRPVKVGKLYEGQRVITEGLKEGERIVVDGLQRVRPGAKVTPKERTQEAGGKTQGSGSTK